MLGYFFDVKKKDIEHRQKFVVVGTAISFVLILGIWIPFQMMRFRTMTGSENVAENETEESPAVAGEATARPLPFLTSSTASSGVPVAPTLEPATAPALTFTASPEPESDTPLIVESSPEADTSATPAATDFPTL